MQKVYTLCSFVTLCVSPLSEKWPISLSSASTRHCYILSQKGQLLSEGDDAYKRLSQSAEWQVRMDVEQIIGQEWLAWLQQYSLPYKLSEAETAQVIPRPKSGP